MINVNSAFNAVFSNQSKEISWTEALLDAQKAIQLNPSSHVGNELKLAALHAHNDAMIIASSIMMLLEAPGSSL
ncbi:hypothetical protein CY34DRAFT_811806 [Suillus luteus UH-Slu-Lm8-n1]|uniref:Uncharacterized protein n=1 Tax=Suillus luteus UH-Slu-Lm8-n1 TaxID=930992 RepID=A0A0D0ACN8_9AGAM|nr:hypothetical protein CY34DRAFT_811806 [Suillus luteus UH-Slu-Lm8-n1]